MAFPDESLSPGEEVKLHLHPHWIVMVAPVFWTLVAVAGVTAAAILLPVGAGNIALIAVGAVALIIFLWLAFAPFVVWRSTHYVFTTKQVLFREGVIRREERGIPLAKVNDVKATQSLFERMLGCGTLTIESAGERGQVVLKDIPGVEKTQSMLYEIVDQDRQRHSFGDDDREALVREIKEEPRQ